MLLLHGGFGTVQDFASQTPDLAKHFRVVAFERPGHGHTADNAEPFSFDTMSSYTVEFIEALKLGATNLVGWSDGALVGLLIALRRPELVRDLVLIGRESGGCTAGADGAHGHHEAGRIPTDVQAPIRITVA